MKNLILLVAATLSLFISACSSNETLYNLTQDANSSRCVLLPPEEKTLCEQNLNKQSYEEYEASKEALKKEQQKPNLPSKVKKK